MDKYVVTFSCKSNSTLFAAMVNGTDFEDALENAKTVRDARMVNPEGYRFDGIEIVSPDSDHVRYARP